MKDRAPLRRIARPIALFPTLLLLSLGLLLGGASAALGLLETLDATWFSAILRWPAQRPAPREVVIVDLPAHATPAMATMSERIRSLGARMVLAAPADAAEIDCTPEIVGGQALRYRREALAKCRRLSEVARQGWPDGKALSPDFGMTTSTTIPRLDMAHLQDAEFAGKVLRGKIVLLAHPQRQPVYVTPMHHRDGLISAAALDAMLVESAVRGRLLRWVAPLSEIMYSALFLVLFLSARRFNRKNPPLLHAAAIAAIALFFSGLLLHMSGLFFPIGSTLAILVTLTALHAIQLRRRIAKRLYRMEFALYRTLRQSRLGGSDADADIDIDPDQSLWRELNALAVEHFGDGRSAMLALAVNRADLDIADLSDGPPETIVETRRDHRIAPYADALAQGRPILLAAPFFGSDASQNTAHQTLMAALSHAGETFGFWILEVDSAMHASSVELSSQVEIYADAFARALYRARHARGTDRVHLPNAPMLEALGEEAVAQIDAYRSLLAASRYATAILDTHGQIQFSNDAFARLAHAAERPLLSMNLWQILCESCGLDLASARASVRKMISTQRMVEHRVVGHDLPAGALIRVYPVARQRRKNASTIEASSHLDLHGIVVEVSGSGDVGARAREFAEAAESMIAESIRALGDAETALECPAREEAVAGAYAHFRIARTSLDRFERLLRTERALSGVSSHCCDLRAILDHALHGAHRRLLERRIECRIEGMPSGHAAADAESLRAMLDDALTLLIEDAVPDSELLCELSRSAEVFSLRLRNRGFGVPEWHLTESMAHPDGASDDDALRRLFAHAAGLEAEHGHLWVTTSLGGGFEISIEVPAET
jgi:PAS domain-containing protein